MPGQLDLHPRPCVIVLVGIPLDLPGPAACSHALAVGRRAPDGGLARAGPARGRVATTDVMEVAGLEDPSRRIRSTSRRAAGSLRDADLLSVGRGDRDLRRDGGVTRSSATAAATTSGGISSAGWRPRCPSRSPRGRLHLVQRPGRPIGRPRSSASLALNVHPGRDRGRRSSATACTRSIGSSAGASRTAVVTVLLVAAYAAAVLVLRGPLGGVVGEGTVSVAISTLVVAAPLPAGPPAGPADRRPTLRPGAHRRRPPDRGLLRAAPRRDGHGCGGPRPCGRRRRLRSAGRRRTLAPGRRSLTASPSVRLRGSDEPPIIGPAGGDPSSSPSTHQGHRHHAHPSTRRPRGRADHRRHLRRRLRRHGRDADRGEPGRRHAGPHRRRRDPDARVAASGRRRQHAGPRDPVVRPEPARRGPPRRGLVPRFHEHRRHQAVRERRRHQA